MKKEFLLDRTAKTLFPWMVALAFLVFWRGHQLPGGGFIGGLVAAAAIVLRRLPKASSDEDSSIMINGDLWMAIGLSTALLSGFLGVIFGSTFFEGVWLPYFDIPLIGEIHLGSPLLFDLGVFITVTTFCIKTAFHFFEVD